MDELKVDWDNKNDTNQLTTPITYPNARFQNTKAARPDDENVENAKNWVDENTK